jgi:two-component system CheB/CheR fusion protein
MKHSSTDETAPEIPAPPGNTQPVQLQEANQNLIFAVLRAETMAEELAVSKETLRVVNEKLNAVNSRLSEKIDELNASNSDLRNLFESTEIATIFLDRHLAIRSYTHASASLYDLKPSDQGRPLTSVATRLQYDGLREDVAQVIATVQPLERHISQRDGSSHYIMRIMPYRGLDDTVNGALLTFIDVTKGVQAEAALRAADTRKDLFLATLSHELRNPLAPIQTAARLLESRSLDSAQMARCQAIIARQVLHLSSLLDDLLDVSRMTRGAFILKKEYVDIRDVLDAAVEAVQPALDAKRHTLRVEHADTQMQLEGDPVRLTQVVSNLLTNAVKYTPAGGLITIGTQLDQQALVISVRDNGIGIAPEMIGQVFTMFTRIESETSRVEGGLGIGLALVKGLVELHGGSVEVRSAGLGQGTQFVVSLPRSIVVDTPRQTQRGLNVDPESERLRRVLIADDNRDGAEVLEMFLTMAGHEVYVAHGGEEAFAVAARCRPDVAVLDIGMPDLNGYELARRIRHEAWGAEIMLIALTGWGQESDKRIARAAGFDHHLTKPVNPDRLNDLLRPAGVPS